MEQAPPGKPQRVPKVAKVKNKAPAEIQITAEQLLREAKERDLEIVAAPPKQKISDPEELAAYRLKKRKGFEDNIRKNRMVIGNWLKYSQWEESQGEIQRARSVYERALDVDHRNITLWLRYAEMEMRSRQVNHARNIWDRAITVMPRVNQFWYKYTYMEEMLGNIAGCRQVFERWMEWHPHEQAWQTYINFELRYKEVDRARAIYERFVYTHPEVGHWIKFARFEEKQGYIRSARKVYERAVEFYGEEYMDEKLFVAFAKFEENQREHERARVIYKYALDNIPKDKAQDLYKAYTIHEKKYGDRTGIESVITSKRRLQYEEALNENPLDYDTWFDLLKLLEGAEELDAELTRETYERAISHVPPAPEKSYWRRYIYLWINYALFEELELQDNDRARQVYKAALDLIPHKSFTFAKLWLLYAHFEVRVKNLQQARKALGTAIGMCPKDKIFRGYIDLEIQLREFDRSRLLYQKFLEFGPENCTTWLKFAELECVLGDLERARAIYELAVNQPRLDMPEILWKTYIDFEVEHGETERARELYYRLLERTSHVKVWLSLSQFELSMDDENSIARARRVFEKANERLRGNEKEERLMLLEGWKAFELANGSEENLESVQEKMPRKIKKRKKIETADGAEAGWEEYFDYIFPEDEAAKPNLKLLAMAKMWKKKKEQEPEAEVEPEIEPEPEPEAASEDPEPEAEEPDASEPEPETLIAEPVSEPVGQTESETIEQPQSAVEAEIQPETQTESQQRASTPSPTPKITEATSPSVPVHVPEVSPSLPASATEPEERPESSSSSSSSSSGSSSSSSSDSSSSSSDSDSEESPPPKKKSKRKPRSP